MKIAYQILLLFIFINICSCTSRNDNRERISKDAGRSNVNKKSKSTDEKQNTSEIFNIHDVDGNIILLKNRTYTLSIELIGVNNTQDVEKYVQDNLRSPVRYITDSQYKPRRKVNGIEFPGYIVDQFGQCINSEIIQEKISGVNKEFLNDSLYVYKKYARQAQLEPERDNSSYSIDELRKATFKVVNYNEYNLPQGMGSGFFVSASGFGISNHHVFEGGSMWEITTCGEGKEYTIYPDDIIGWSESLDYVVFKINEEDKVSYLPISTKMPEQGNDILVYGNPKGLTCTLSKGVVSAIRDKYGNNEYIQIDAAISAGSSGSPIVNKKGEVVAIATMKQLGCENCNFGMNIEVVKPDFPY